MLSDIHPLESPVEKAWGSARLHTQPRPSQFLRLPCARLDRSAGLGFNSAFSGSGLKPEAASNPGLATRRPEPGVCSCSVRRGQLYPPNPALTEHFARVALGEHTAAQLSRAHMDFELQRGSVRERAAPLGHVSGYRTRTRAPRSDRLRGLGGDGRSTQAGRSAGDARGGANAVSGAG